MATPPMFGSPIDLDSLMGGAVPPAPSFDAPGAMPPAAAMPAAPTFGPPKFSPPQPTTKQQLAQILPALLFGLKDAGAMGAALRGIQRGRDRRMAQYEQEFERQERQARERAEFEGRMLQAAAQIEDEIAFTDWARAVGPVAEYYGVPLPQFPKAKRDEAYRKKVLTALDRAVKEHGSEILNNSQYSIGLDDGTTVSMATALALRGGTVTEGGKAVPVKPALGKSLQPKNLSVNGQRVTGNYNPEDGKFYDQSGAVIPNAQLYDEPSPETSTQQKEVLLDGKPAFAFFDPKAKKYFSVSGEDVTTRVQPIPPASNSGPNSVQDQRRFNMEQRLVTQWDKANAPFREMRRQYGLMETGLRRFKQGDKNGGSQAILVTFQKILDPASVVRESEYARSPQGVSALQRMEGFVDRLRVGGAGVPESALAEMVQTAKEFLDGMTGYTDGLRQRITRTAGEYQLDPRFIFDDVEPSAPAAAPGGRPAVTHRFNPATGKVEPVK